MNVFNRLYEFLKSGLHPKKGVKIHPTAIVYENVILEDGVEIGAYSVIGAPAEVKDQSNRDSLGKVYIGENTIIREHVTIHSSRHKSGVTYIGYDCYIQAHAHIGHDCNIKNNSIVACFACLGGHTELEEHTNVALHAVTHPRTVIRKGTILGANSFAKGVLDKWSVYVGNPAKRIKPNNRLREKLHLVKLDE